MNEGTPETTEGMWGEDAAQPVKFHAPEVVFGTDSLAEIGLAAVRLGARRPFVVSDSGVSAAGWTEETLDYLRREGLRPQLWTDVTPNPKEHEIQRGYEEYIDSGADVIIGIGGGSVIDAAKGVAILAGNGGKILDFEGVDQISHPIPPMIMAPTTAGTGADVSQFCVVSDTERHIKVTILGRALVPDISITDPRLLTTMPVDLAAATGLDALSHGIEAFVSLAHNPLSDLHALNSVRLVDSHLVRTLETPEDLTSRRAMAQASLEAGMAFSNAILGATHAMSHQVGGLIDAPHGVVNAVLLSHVVSFNALGSPERYRPLAEVFGLSESRAPVEQMARALAAYIRSLADRVGVPKGLAALGVTEADIPLLTKSTLHDACLTTNPRLADENDVHRLFVAAM
ncbi:MAG TPA: iron-containing alcohol dehydrogenase [Dietzia timorensis]|uniref:Iron-containing alcohol dehydrogenase n=1 Tax=Dietzia timorensis TaxID=499555 RepID=A0A921F7H4_9ACTN|nr:iron-containing alcohol dehydrogenase [Dietzia timorensis]HJE91544.1 iron-containing alcohol dehydrogenase [Dietzia timorensis]